MRVRKDDHDPEAPPFDREQLTAYLTSGLAMGCDPQMQRVVARLGKPFTSIAIPTGLPRFRAKSQCWYNAQRAVINDPRLRYVEGVALSHSGRWVGHAWVTMDGEHAIDVTWRGQRVALFRDGTGTTILYPADEYFGVEVPTTDVAGFIVRRKSYDSILADWAEEPAH